MLVDFAVIYLYLASISTNLTTTVVTRRLKDLFRPDSNHFVMELPSHNNSSHAATPLDTVASMGRRRSSNESAPSTTGTNKSNNVTADQIEDILARMVHRVDLQESHEGDGSTAERWNEDSPKSNTAFHPNADSNNHSGPLTSQIGRAHV